MTREQAKVYCLIPRDEIEKINRGYGKNYEMMRAYAFGADLQSRSRFNPRAYWENITEPSFEECFEYRELCSAEAATKGIPYPTIDGLSLSEGEIALVRAVRALEFLALFEGELEVIDWESRETEPVLVAIGATTHIAKDNALVEALKQIREEKGLF